MVIYRERIEIVLEENDIVFSGNWRISSDALDKKIFPVFRDVLKFVKLDPTRIGEILKERIKIVCPCGKEWTLLSIDREHSLLQYQCKGFNCYKKVTMNLRPLRF